MTNSTRDRLGSIHADRRLLVAAAVAFSVAAAAGAYGVVYDDVVTAISALPFVPAALLLAAIALSTGSPGGRGPRGGGAA
jgi:hypothetical protein